MGPDNVWPPAPESLIPNEGKRPEEQSEIRHILGVASLILTLPGLLNFALAILNRHVMYWKTLTVAAKALDPLPLALVLLLPLLGFCIGTAGWRSFSGKLGVVASIIHYIFVAICWKYHL